MIGHYRTVIHILPIVFCTMGGCGSSTLPPPPTTSISCVQELHSEIERKNTSVVLAEKEKDKNEKKKDNDNEEEKQKEDDDGVDVVNDDEVRNREQLEKVERLAEEGERIAAEKAAIALAEALEREQIRSDRIAKREKELNAILADDKLNEQLYIRWKSFVENGDKIVLSSRLSKLSAAYLVGYQERQLILTDKPSLIYVNIKTMESEKNMSIFWDPADPPVAVKVGHDAFEVRVYTPTPRTYSFRVLEADKSVSVDTWILNINNVTNEKLKREQLIDAAKVDIKKDRRESAAFLSGPLFGEYYKIEQQLLQLDRGMLGKFVTDRL